MKKLPLALSALAISTISVAGMANPTYAETTTRLDYNTGNLDDLLLKITKLNLRDNTISFIAEDIWPTGLSSTYMEIHNLDSERKNEKDMDLNYTSAYGVGYRAEGTWSIFNNYMRRVGTVAGVETLIPSNMMSASLADNESKVIYYLGQVGSHGMAGGKIDYSRCVDSSSYRVAMEIAKDDDVVECRAEMDDDGEGYHYQPYYNGARLTIPAEEEAALDAAALARMKAADERDAAEAAAEAARIAAEEEAKRAAEEEAKRAEEEAAKAAEEAARVAEEAKAAEEARKAEEAKAAEEAAAEKEDARATAEAAKSESVVVDTSVKSGDSAAVQSEQTSSFLSAVKNTETEVSTSGYAEVATASGGSEIATVTSEGSASQNSEDTGVEGASEYASDADVWAVDESKVWEDDAAEVDTPELGEEDCGCFWSMVAGWVLAMLGWGAVAVLLVEQQKK